MKYKFNDFDQSIIDFDTGLFMFDEEILVKKIKKLYPYIVIDTWNNNIKWS